MLRRGLVLLVVLGCATGLLAAVGPGKAHGGAWPVFLTDSQGRALFLYGLDATGSGLPDGVAEDAVPTPAPSVESTSGKDAKGAKGAKKNAKKQQSVQPPADTVTGYTGAKGPATEYAALGDDFVRLRVSGASPAQLRAVQQQVSAYGAAGYRVMLTLPPLAAPHSDLHWYDLFWGTASGGGALREDYVAEWTRVAAAFADDPTVIGYDLLDSPWGGSVQGPAFEAGPLASLYRTLIARIRTVDTAHWLFVEPAATANRGIASALPHLSDPRSGAPRIGYAPQLFPETLAGRDYTGNTSFLTDRFVASWEKQVERTAKRLDAPVVVVSWGADANQPDTHLYVDHVQTTFGAMLAGAAWDAGPVGSPSSPWQRVGHPADIAPVLGTAYPRAVAGLPVAFDYDKGTTVLTLSFDTEAGVTGSTDVYLPPDDFPNGPQVEDDSDATFGQHWDAARHVLSLTVPKSPPGTLHSFRITPAVVQ